MSLATELAAAGLNVKTVTGWGSRGYKWAAGQPVGVMHHHTYLPVPFPVNRLYGDLLKCNINTKPDGTVWLIAQGACNYSSGPGSSIVLGEVRSGNPPTQNARERGLKDDIDCNPWYFNFENDHIGDGSPIPQAQFDALITATEVVNDHYGLSARNVTSHAESTYRKRDPNWSPGGLRAIDEIREALNMPTPAEIAQAVWAFPALTGTQTMHLLADRNYRNINELTVAHRAGKLGTTAFAEIADDDLADIAKAVNDELARRAQS